MIQGNALLIVFLILFIAPVLRIPALGAHHLASVPPRSADTPAFAGHLDGNPWRR